MLNAVKLSVIAAGLVFGSSAFGATVGAGTFNLSGTAVGTSNGIEFYLHTPGDQQGAVLLPTSGVFGDLAATTTETIQNLTSSNGVMPGTTFNFQNWIQLTDGINLDATTVPIPTIYPVCSASGSVAAGYQCIVNANSPVILTQTGTGVAARINVMGDAHYANDPTLTAFTGLFTSPTTNFATIADFETYYNSNGYIPAISYSASFTTTATPEPGAIVLASCGLLAFGLMKLKRNTR